MEKLVIYDTSNFVDFPIGGQLTSIKNFLVYIVECQREFCERITLIGITNETEKVGKKTIVNINGVNFDFIPVVYRDTDLKNIKSSMRVEYLRGLFKYRNYIPCGKEVLHYIHTPEAFIQVKLCHPFGKTAIFSHGSFFNMIRGFRFFQNNKIVGTAFELFIKWMLSKANLIFVLDDDSLDQYSKYNNNIVKVNNSIVLPNNHYSEKRIHDPIRLLFVGRLSKVKRVDEIIQAVDSNEIDVVLTIVGDGEESEYLQSITKTERVQFKGALKPEKVKAELEEADILVMNSILEGKPMAIIEAMSFGLPIITTDVGGIKELVSFGHNAIMTDGSSKSIQLAIIKVLQDYSNMVNASLILSYDYDYRKINRLVFINLEKV